MKKIINNKIFLIIVFGIICLSTGVGATTLYQASQIEYIPKDTSWDVKSVNVALDELYSKINKSSGTYFQVSSVKELNYGINGSWRTDSQYDIKTLYSDYKNITIDNIDVKIISGYHYDRSGGGVYNLQDSYKTSYDPSTGIVTVSALNSANWLFYSYDHIANIYILI